MQDVDDGFRGKTSSWRKHYFVIIKNLKLLGESMGTPKLVQFSHSKPHVVLTYMESKFSYLQQRKTDQNPGLSYPEDQTATWRSHNIMIQITLQKVVNQPITQASGDRTRYYQAQRRLVRYSQRHCCLRYSAG